MKKGEIDLERLCQVEGAERLVRYLTQYAWDEHCCGSAPEHRALMGRVYERLCAVRDCFDPGE